MTFKSFFLFFSLLLALLYFNKSKAQINIMGKPGYMITPSADWLEGQPLGFTFSYIPSEYSKNILFTPRITTENTPLNFYNVRATLTSFFEVNLSIAYRPEINNKIGVGDRQLDFRFRLLKEKEFWPSIVLGWTPPGSDSPVLAHDYLVATKHLNTTFGNFSTSLGYGSPYVFSKKRTGKFLDLKVQKKNELYGEQYLSGFYGAFSYMPVNFAGIMVEYDTQTMNAGAFIKVKDWLYLQAYTFEGKEIAFTTSLNFSLNFAPHTLRRYEKKLD